MTTIFWRLLAFAIFLALLPLIPFPPIPQEALDVVTSSVKVIYWFNRYVPIDTLFKFASYILVIEMSFFILRVYGIIHELITGNPFTFSLFRQRAGIDMNIDDRANAPEENGYRGRNN